MSLRFNPTTGQLDLVDDTLPGIVSKTYTASEAISALKMVASSGLNTIGVADKDSLPETLGMAVTAGGIGSDIEVVTFGQVDDASFTFGVNACLFLDSTGSITATAPTTGNNVPIGKSLANGSIFIDIDNITKL